MTISLFLNRAAESRTSANWMNVCTTGKTEMYLEILVLPSEDSQCLKHLFQTLFDPEVAISTLFEIII